MLLQEIKEEKIKTCYFKSSNIVACRYKPATKQLAIIFKGGTQYLYENVTNYTYQRFKVSESQGVAFNRFIKNKFKFKKVADKIDLTEIFKIIQELQKT